MRLGVAAAVVGRELVPGDVAVVDGVVTGLGLSRAGGRGVALPGFVDLQTNGYAGVDLLDAASGDRRRAEEALAADGTTSYLATFPTAPEETLRRALAELGAGEAPDGVGGTVRGAARLLGAHLEGPFISPGHLGIHRADHRRDPDPDLLARLLGSGPVAMVTLAPELPGALALVEELAARGVTVSVGHTDADARQTARAFDAGARTMTHLWNAMRPPRSRDPGPIGAALRRDDVTIQLIVDGHHLADETVALTWRAAAGRVALVTDATAAAAGEDGSYTIAGTEVTRVDGTVRDEDGRLAGSALTMIAALRNLHTLGVPLAACAHAAATVPAATIGRGDVGRLRPGARADIVVLDDRLEIHAVLIGGLPVGAP